MDMKLTMLWELNLSGIKMQWSVPLTKTFFSFQAPIITLSNENLNKLLSETGGGISTISFWLEIQLTIFEVVRELVRLKQNDFYEVWKQFMDCSILACKPSQKYTKKKD